jgi:excisionase family DNA binding protein
MGSTVANRPGSGRPLKSSEAAAALGVSERTLRRYARDGRIRYHRLPGGHYRIPEEAIEEFWHEQDAPRRGHPHRTQTKAAPSTRRAGARVGRRRPALGTQPPQDYDLSPDRLAELRAQFS